MVVELIQAPNFGAFLLKTAKESHFWVKKNLFLLAIFAFNLNY